MNDDFHDTICHGDAGDQVESAPRRRGRALHDEVPERVLDEARQNTPYGASNLLDSALVFVTSDTAWGKIHTKAEWPVLFVGKAGGRLRGDEHHNFPSENLSKALLSVAQIMGANMPEIGIDAGYVNAPLSGIQV